MGGGGGGKDIAGGGRGGISVQGMRRFRGLFIKGGEVKRDGREGLEDGWGEAGTKRKGMDRGMGGGYRKGR